MFQYILTAAHCVDGFITFDILIGAHHIKAGSEPGRIEVTSTDAVHHEKWDHHTLANDIALIRLSDPIKFNDYMKPSCLPSRNGFLRLILTAIPDCAGIKTGLLN